MNIVDHSYNLWNEKWELGAYSILNGTKVESSVSLRNKEPIPIRPNRTYYIKCNPVGARLYFYDISKNYLSTALANNSTFTSPNNAYFLSFNSGNASVPITDYNHDICINVSKNGIDGNYYLYYYNKYDIVDKILPNEYQGVEYIESTGTQYINTNVLLTQDFKLQYKVNVTELTTIGMLWGSYVGGNRYDTQVRTAQPDLWQVQRGNNYTYVSGFSIAKDFVIEETLDTFVVDNITNSISGTFSQNYVKVGIFANLGNDIYPSKCRIYYFKIYDGSTLVRDFIPCYRKSDNVIGLYDLVGKQFYTNQGTGTFLKGANINKHIKYQRLKIGG